MEPDYPVKRSELRFLIEAGATVEVSKNGQTVHATTVNMSPSGVLLNFEEPAQLAVGDHVICEFKVAHEPGSPLPYWGVGNVVRVGNSSVAVLLKAGGFSPLKSETGGATPREI